MSGAGGGAQPLPQPRSREAYRWFLRIPTRWSDNDAYGHVNNVVYYVWFDTAVNAHLVDEGKHRIHGEGPIGVVVENGCRFYASVAYPEPVEAGLRVATLGARSVVYELAILRPGEDEAVATGRFVHVWVDRETRRPVPVPVQVRAALERIRA